MGDQMVCSRHEDCGLTEFDCRMADSRTPAQKVADVLHADRHGADGYSCPAPSTAPHPKDRVLAGRIVEALDLSGQASPATGAGLPRTPAQFRLVQDWTGMGLTVQVIAVAAHEGQDVLVFAHSHAMDGEMNPEVRELLDSMAAWTGGYEQVT